MFLFYSFIQLNILVNLDMYNENVYSLYNVYNNHIHYITII